MVVLSSGRNVVIGETVTVQNNDWVNDEGFAFLKGTKAIIVPDHPDTDRYMNEIDGVITVEIGGVIRNPSHFK